MNIRAPKPPNGAVDGHTEKAWAYWGDKQITVCVLWTGRALANFHIKQPGQTPVVGDLKLEWEEKEKRLCVKVDFEDVSHGPANDNNELIIGATNKDADISGLVDLYNTHGDGAK